MHNLYNLYRLQIILTVAALLFQGIARWIVMAFLFLLMLGLGALLRYTAKLSEKDEEEWEQVKPLAEEAWKLMEQKMRKGK